jgi:large subunit ribosomal protein L21
MKYVIVQAFGKQNLFKSNEYYDIQLTKNIPINSFLNLQKILFFKKELNLQIGKPFLENSNIIAKVTQTIKLPKITILKTKPKKKYTRVKGLHQLKTRIYIY